MILHSEPRSGAMTEISISCDGHDSYSEFQEKIAASENSGAAAIWIANHLFQRDPVSLGAMALAQTKRMRLALMAMNPLTMHPVQAAMSAATLDEFFPGRVTLCLGVGTPGDLKSVGIEAEKPLSIMREALELVRALLAGETVRVDGEFFSVQGRRLGTGARPVPLVLAASGPRMLELAGATADGVLLSAGTSIEFVKRLLERVHSAAKGRPVRSHALVYAAVDEDETLAHDRLRRVLAIVLRGSHHAPNLRQGGSSLDQSALNEAVIAKDWSRAEALITDDIVRRHAASGRPEQMRQRFAAYQAAGLDEIVVAGARDVMQITQIMRAA
jgi:5,10-methylenetetrahydromethanopterin reductase